MLQAATIAVVSALLLAGVAVAEPTTRPTAALAEMAWQPYGEPASEGASLDEAIANDAAIMVPVADVLADPAKYADRELYLTGNITAVCQKAGCWVKLMPEGVEPAAKPGLDTSSVFVKLTCPTTGFLVPVESVNRPAVTRGKIVIETMEEDAARHYAEDDGATPEQVLGILGPQQVVRLMTPGVWVAAE